MKSFLFFSICLTVMTACSCFPNGADTDVEETRRLLKSDRYDDAIRYATDSISRHPADARLYYNRGFCRLNKIDPEINASLADFEKSIELDPKYSDGYYGMGLWYMTFKKDYEKARQMIEKASSIACDDERKNIYIGGLANLYYTKGDYPAAIKTIKEFIRRTGKSDGYFHLGLFYFETNRLAEAVSAWKQGLKIDDYLQTEFKHKSYYHLAQCYKESGDLVQSKEYIDKALTLAPNREKYIDFKVSITNE